MGAGDRTRAHRPVSTGDESVTGLPAGCASHIDEPRPPECPKPKSFVEVSRGVALADRQSQPLVTRAATHPERVPEQQTTKSTALEWGDHEDLRNPRVSRPPFCCRHPAHDNRSCDGAVGGADQSRRSRQDRTAWSAPIQELSPVFSAIHPRPDGVINMSGEHGPSCGGGDAIDVAVDCLQEQRQRRHMRGRNLHSVEVNRHVVGKSPEPPACCEESRRLCAIVRSEHVRHAVAGGR